MHISLLFLFFAIPLKAQELTKLTNTVIDIQNHFPTKESASLSSDLEDKVAEVCEIPSEPEGIDEKSSMPEPLKKDGWKVLFEVQYNPIAQDDRTLSSHFIPKGSGVNFENTYSAIYGRSIPNDLAGINQAAQDLNPYYSVMPQESVRNILIIRQLEKAQTPNQMYAQFNNYSGGMNKQEKLNFLANLGSYITYDQDRAQFMASQDNGAKGKISPFQIMRENSPGGICGDIHSTIAKFAEMSGFEAFTIGYALSNGDFKQTGPQHVITAVVDPSNKGQVHLINYGTIETNDLSKGKSLKLAPESSPGTGIIYRIFKNSGDPETGKMQQIGVLPTSLKGFFDELTKREFQLQKVMPQNMNFQQNKVGFKHEKESKYDRAKTSVHKQLGSGLVVYQGSTQEGDIWGVAISHDNYKKIYSKDGNLKRSKYFSTTLSGSLLDNNAFESGPDAYMIYLKMTGGKIFHLIESPQFKFGGAVGYNFEAMMVSNKESGVANTADINGETFMQVLAEYQKKNTHISMALKLDTTLAMKDQNLMTDLSALKSNIDPLKPNALKANIDVTQTIDEKTKLTGSAAAILTNMGSQVIVSTGIIKNATSVELKYTAGLGSAGLSKNHIKQTNLLTQTLGFDGTRLSAGQGFQNRSRTIKGQVGGYAGISNLGQGYGGVSLKLDLSKKTKGN